MGRYRICRVLFKNRTVVHTWLQSPEEIFALRHQIIVMSRATGKHHKALDVDIRSGCRFLGGTYRDLAYRADKVEIQDIFQKIVGLVSCSNGRVERRHVPQVCNVQSICLTDRHREAGIRSNRNISQIVKLLHCKVLVDGWHVCLHDHCIFVGNEIEIDGAFGLLSRILHDEIHQEGCLHGRLLTMMAYKLSVHEGIDTERVQLFFRSPCA